MFIHSLGRRIKNFLKLTARIKKRPQEVVHEPGDMLNTQDELKEDRVERWYYDNGVLKAECIYRHNKLEGISTFHYENGNLRAKETYKDGRLEGLSKRYNEFGELVAEEYYRLGTLIRKETYK